MKNRARIEMLGWRSVTGWTSHATHAIVNRRDGRGPVIACGSPVVLHLTPGIKGRKCRNCVRVLASLESGQYAELIANA